MPRIGWALLVAAGLAFGLPAGASATAVPVPGPAGLTQWSISGMSCPTATSCVAVGGGPGQVFFDVWDGLTWTPVPAPVPPGATSVSCASASACMAVGNDSVGTNSPIGAERWNGRGWDVLPIPDPGGASIAGLRGVTCATATSCVAVGDYEPAGIVDVPLIEAWNGSSWTLQPSPTVPGASLAELSAVSCASPSYCVAVGASEGGATGGGLIDIWNGYTWQIAPAANPPGIAQLASIACPLPSWCVAVGSSAPQYQPLASAPLVETLIDGHWTVETPPSPPAGGLLAQLGNVSCNAYLVCMATGRYEDAGGTDHALAYVRVDGAWSIYSGLADLTSVTELSCGPLTCEALGGSASPGLFAEQLPEPPPPATAAPAGGSTFALSTPGAAACVPSQSVLTAGLSATVTNAARARRFAFVNARLYLDRGARPAATIRRLPARTSVPTGALRPGPHSLTVRIALRHRDVTSTAGLVHAGFAVCTE